MMAGLTILTGILAPIDRDNVDTDAIIPAERTLAVTTKIGDGLFGGWRYRQNATPNPDFILNKAPWSGATMLVSGSNFGCGSSRENAVWALEDFGIRAIFAESFGDIFAANCARRGLLAQRLDAQDICLLREAAKDPQRCVVTLDVPSRCVHVGNEIIGFEIDTTLHERLMRGASELDEIIEFKGDIEAFQKKDIASRPWVYRIPER